MTRDSFFNMRISTEERAQLDAAAAACGCDKVSEFIRFAADQVNTKQWQAPITDQSSVQL